MPLKTSALKGHHLEVTPAIRGYIEKKLKKVNKLVDSDDTSATADVEVGKIVPDQHSGDIFYCQINLHVRGEYFSSKAERDDLYAAIDEVQEELLRDLKKHKGKKETLVRRGARKMKEMIRGFQSPDDV